jgi:hypothetical protein
VYARSDDMLFSPVGLEGEDVTPAGIRSALFQRHDYARALLMALQLGDCGGSSYTSSGVMPSSSSSSSLMAVGSRGRKSSILDEAIEAIPSDQVALVLRSPGFRDNQAVVCRLVEGLAPRLAASTRLEFYLAFSLEVLRAHGHLLLTADSAANTRSATARGALGSGGLGHHASRGALAARLLVALRALQKAVLRQQKTLLTLCDENQYTLRFLDSQLLGLNGKSYKGDSDRLSSIVSVHANTYENGNEKIQMVDNQKEEHKISDDISGNAASSGVLPSSARRRSKRKKS